MYINESLIPNEIKKGIETETRNIFFHLVFAYFSNFFDFYVIFGIVRVINVCESKLVVCKL